MKSEAFSTATTNRDINKVGPYHPTQSHHPITGNEGRSAHITTPSSWQDTTKTQQSRLPHPFFFPPLPSTEKEKKKNNVTQDPHSPFPWFFARPFFYASRTNRVTFHSAPAAVFKRHRSHPHAHPTQVVLISVRAPLLLHRSLTPPEPRCALALKFPWTTTITIDPS